MFRAYRALPEGYYETFETDSYVPRVQSVAPEGRPRPGSGFGRLEDGGRVISPKRPEALVGPETPRGPRHLEAYRANGPADGPGASLRGPIAGDSRLDPLPTREVVGRGGGPRAGPVAGPGPRPPWRRSAT
jgi:hypothetical protein